MQGAPQALQRLLAAALLRQHVAAATPGDPGDPQQPLATSPLAQLCQPTRPSQGRPLRALRGAVRTGGLKGSASEDRAGGREPPLHPSAHRKAGWLPQGTQHPG